MTKLTPKARRILGFVEGFQLCFKMGPDFSQIWRYETGSTVRHNVRSQMETLLGRLEQEGYIRRVGERFHVVSPQRSVAFAFNRSTGTLEPLHGTDQNNGCMARIQD